MPDINDPSQFENLQHPDNSRFFRFGDPNATRRLDKPVDETHNDQNMISASFQDSRFFTRTRIGRTLEPYINNRPSAEQNKILLSQYTTFVNIFFRDRPAEMRKMLIEKLLNSTENFLKWEKREGGAVTIHSPVLSKTNILIEKGIPLREQIFHEALHFVQRERLLPQNHALTYAATCLLELMEGKDQFVKRGDNGGTFYPFYLDKNEYFSLVLNNNPGRAYSYGFLRYPEFNKDYWTYILHESQIEEHLTNWGETDIPPIFGINEIKLYDMVKNIGSYRARRAFAVGVLSGNIDHSWSILYLHANGMSFDDAEKSVVGKIMDGTISEMYNFETVGNK